MIIDLYERVYLLYIHPNADKHYNPHSPVNVQVDVIYLFIRN